MIFKIITVLSSNLLICVVLLSSYSLNVQLGQAISMVTAGLVIGSLFAIPAWLIDRSEMNDMEKRNFLIPLYVILSITIFWLAASIGDGSIFQLHEIEDLDFFSLIFTGGFFGLMMGFSRLFDYALLNNTPISRLALLVSLVGFSMTIVWYSPTNGLLFIASVIAARMILSIFLYRVFGKEIEKHITTLFVFILSLTLTALPLTAFLSK